VDISTYLRLSGKIFEKFLNAAEPGSASGSFEGSNAAAFVV
jgi:hypothetical protein